MAENELIGLFDTHAHPTDERFDEDRAEVLSRMRQAGMLCMCVGADMASSAQSVTLANENDNIYAAVGVHPHDAKSFTEADVPQLIRWLTQEKKSQGAWRDRAGLFLRSFAQRHSKGCV